MIVVIIYCTIDAGRRDEFLTAVAELVSATRQEAGNLAYGCYSDPTNSTKMTFVEEWETREAMEAHMAQPHTKAFLQFATSILTTAPSARVFEIAKTTPLFG